MCSIYSAPSAATEASKIKAAFIEKLTRFIEWPTDQSSPKDQSFSICIIGKDTLDGALDQLAEITQVKGKPLAIHYLRRVEDINNCNALFISATMSSQLPAVLKHIKQRPILTIGDTTGYAAQGVMVNFFVDKGRLRFEINSQAANEAGIMVGSRVLKLARIVGEEV